MKSDVNLVKNCDWLKIARAHSILCFVTIVSRKKRNAPDSARCFEGPRVFEYEKKNVNSKNGNSLELIHVEEKEKSGKQKVRAFLITCTFVTKKKPQNFKKV